MWLKELYYVLHLGCLGVLVDVDVDVICFFFHFQSIFEKAKSNFWRITEWLLRWKLHSTQSSKQAQKKFYLLSTLSDISMRFIRCVNSLLSKPSTMNAKQNWKIFLFQYREYLDLKQHVDQLRNKQKHLRSQRDVSNIQSL